jgi:hypothetical protein
MKSDSAIILALDAEISPTSLALQSGGEDVEKQLLTRIAAALADNVPDVSWSISRGSHSPLRLRIVSTSGGLSAKMRKIQEQFERTFEDQQKFSTRIKKESDNSVQMPSPYLILRSYHANTNRGLQFINAAFSQMGIGVYFESTFDGFLIIFATKEDFEFILQKLQDI